MTERPILFSAPMVRALLDGTKTQTRRAVKLKPWHQIEERDDGTPWPWMHDNDRDADHWIACPYGQPGDRVWVRETWQYYDWDEEGEPCIRYAADNATAWPIPSGEDWADRLVDVWERLSRHENYSIDNRARDRRWRPSIHMPRWASRILLEVTAVRVERLQDISRGDAMAEGIQPLIGSDGPNYWTVCVNDVSISAPTAQDCFGMMWEYINGDDSWTANPWVWVVEFKRVQP
jgi:hypothetical protein